MSMTKVNNTWVMATAAAALIFMLGSGAMVQQAFAHASTTLTLDEEPVAGKKVRVSVGHSNEPTYGAQQGIHDGKHNFEVFLADSDTRIPLTGASLKVDKYYFQNINTFQKASSLDQADGIEKGVTVGSVFGDPGHYLARQVQLEGIYGYRLYGTVNYFSVGTVDIDSTIFCKSPDGDTTKFNSAGWSGSFGCTENIKDIFFPEKKPSTTTKASFEVPADGGSSQVKQVSLVSGGAPESAAMNIAASATAPASASAPMSASFFQLMAALGIPAAAVASFFGIRTIRQRKDSEL